MFGGGVPETGVTEVPEDGYLLDVREDDEWRAGHAPDAVHIPLGELGGRADEVPKDRKVYVVCRVGGRSAQAVMALNQAGWDSVNVAGGMAAWERAGREMAAEADAEPRVV
ncbi:MULTISPECIES: rhodanese-like domain-containing protein [Nocardiopsis]|uniref:Rhodanese-related sulfurtransferase n=1 Tax=Nocardiopsis aegyptia TaxID=220378 RepID=A0A7Z0JAI6_9ACTN|nr:MULTISPECIES: rhodanese-like domain-containing protein [Nocardiopsis]KOX13219.1 sulfurtransferase [Nocardiopsis sp. NRRL B-16309]NYJ35328.1 rhodanese-related sulfurtransferase [Nocardiopsis aegyptia]